MTLTTALCIIACVFIVCLFGFFALVYISELRREQRLRNFIAEEDKYISNFLKGETIPVLVMDKSAKTPQEEPANKTKKDVN